MATCQVHGEVLEMKKLYRIIIVVQTSAATPCDIGAFELQTE